MSPSPPLSSSSSSSSSSPPSSSNNHNNKNEAVSLDSKVPDANVTKTETTAVTLGSSSNDKDSCTPAPTTTMTPKFPARVVTTAAEETSSDFAIDAATTAAAVAVDEKAAETAVAETTLLSSSSSSSSSALVSLSSTTPKNSTTEGWSLFLELQPHQLQGGRSLLDDRRGWFFHYRPRTLLESTLRILAVQSGNILSNFVLDQATGEQERADLVQEGKLTAAEADREAYKWEQREWSLRWLAFPRLFLQGLAKYHAATLLMRLMEYSLSHVVSPMALDRLTLDIVKAAARMGRNSKVSFIDNVYLCLSAGLLGVVADTTVEHFLLGCEYWLFYQSAFQKKKKKREAETKDEEEEEEEEEKDDSVAIFLSFALKYTQIWVTKLAALAGSSVGGALGTKIWPGFWGTGMGINFGDAVVVALMG